LQQKLTLEVSSTGQKHKQAAKLKAEVKQKKMVSQVGSTP
jgi:hypothetical protein